MNLPYSADITTPRLVSREAAGWGSGYGRMMGRYRNTAARLHLYKLCKTPCGHPLPHLEPPPHLHLHLWPPTGFPPSPRGHSWCGHVRVKLSIHIQFNSDYVNFSDIEIFAESKVKITNIINTDSPVVLNCVISWLFLCTVGNSLFAAYTQNLLTKSNIPLNSHTAYSL